MGSGGVNWSAKAVQINVAIVAYVSCAPGSGGM